MAKPNLLFVDRTITLRIHFVGMMIVIVLYAILDPIIAVLVGGMINFVIYITIGFLEARRDPLYFNPISFYFFWYSVNLGLSAIYSSTLLAAEGGIGFSTARVYDHSVALGFLIYTIGSFALHAGLQLNRPKTPNKIIGEKVFIKKAAFISFLIVGLMFELFTPYFAVFGGLLSFLRFSMISGLALIAFNPNNFLKFTFITRRNILFIGSILVFTLNISTTSKAYMMFAFFPLVWFMLYYKVDILKLAFTGFVFAMLYFFFVYPLSYELRASFVSTRQVNVQSSVETVLEGKTNAIDPQFRDRHPIYGYLSRSFDAIAVAYLTTQVDKYGFRYGETMAFLGYSLIPRIFWPSKPAVSQSAWFTYYLGFAPSPEKATVSVGMTATGELYWNFGIPGVIIGMFIVGVCFSGLWRLAGLHPQYSIISMLLFINILFGMPNMSEFGSVITTFVLTYLTFKTAYIIRDKFILKGYSV
jgi:hypothetical protein